MALGFDGFQASKKFRRYYPGASPELLKPVLRAKSGPIATSQACCDDCGEQESSASSSASSSSLSSSRSSSKSSSSLSSSRSSSKSSSSLSSLSSSSDSSLSSSSSGTPCGECLSTPSNIIATVSDIVRPVGDKYLLACYKTSEWPDPNGIVVLERFIGEECAPDDECTWYYVSPWPNLVSYESDCKTVALTQEVAYIYTLRKASDWFFSINVVFTNDIDNPCGRSFQVFQGDSFPYVDCLSGFSIDNELNPGCTPEDETPRFCEGSASFAWS